MKWEQLELLYLEFKELKIIYDRIGEGYDDGIAFRQILFEEKKMVTRINLFIQSHRNILVLLKKKDMANYLHMDYNNFVRLFSKLL